MGLEKSNLSNEKIKKIALDNYGIKIETITQIFGTTQNVWCLDDFDKKYILKEFISSKKQKDIEKEIKIVNFLKEKGLRVPIYVPTKNNKLYLENEGRVITMQEYIYGDIVENNTGNYEQVIESANILGKITKLLLEYPKLSEEGIIEKNFSKESLEKNIVKLKQLIERVGKLEEDNSDKILEDLEFKIKILENIKDKFDFQNIRKMTILNSHGDFSVRQLIYSKNEETAVIDFERAKSLPIVWEVIRSYCYIDENAKNGEIDIEVLVKYFEEFQKYIKLNEYDLKYVSYIYLLQLAGSGFGYKEYLNNNKEVELLKFAFFRTKTCEFLSKNLEEISKKLLMLK